RSSLNYYTHVCLPMISENKEIIYSIKRSILPSPVPIIRVTTNECKSSTGATSSRILYLKKEGQLLYPLDGGEIEMIKAELGSYAFAAQYQQNPLPLSSGIIKQEWLKRYRNFPDNLSHITQSWDTAVSTNDSSGFSVCTTWTKVNNKFYLLDVYRAKLEYPKLKEQVLSLAARWKPHAILIEAKTSGQQLIQELKAIPIIGIVPHGGKLARFHQIVPIIESGKVFLPHQAVWLSDFEYEILMFPETRHDDQVDSAVQYLQWMRDSSFRVAAIRTLLIQEAIICYPQFRL
uniref:phage terminase large subunit n=1 Tax=Wolbachia endosymbiont of Nasonia vitripennis TaxID=180837 RepID=UPI0002374C86